MRAYRIKTDLSISPFGEHPLDLPVLNRDLRWHQESVLGGMGIEIEDVSGPVEGEEERLEFPDCTFFTPGLIEEFVSRSMSLARGTACCLSKGCTTTRLITPTMDLVDQGGSLRFGLSYIPRGWSGELEPLVIDPDEDVERMRFPRHMVPGGEYWAPLTTRWMTQIEHWSNLWAANVAGVLGQIRELKRSSRGRLLGLALRARSTDPWKVSSKNVVVGKDCDVHHTAYLENAVLGDGVEVGAGTVIRGARIGDGVAISNSVSILLSVVGEGCAIRDGSCIQFSLLLPGAFCSCRFLNCVTMGRDTFMGDGTAMTDFRFDGGNATVMKEGRRIDTGGVFLGPCIGHRSYIGSGVVVGPTREIPNDTRVVVGRSRIIMGAGIEGDFERVRRYGEEGGE